MSGLSEDLAYRVARLEEQLRQLLVRALVTQIDAEMYRVRVKYPEQPDVESAWLQVMTVKSHKDKYYALPDVDEQVLVLHLPGSQEIGYVLCTSYSEPNPPPEGAGSEDITLVNWGEGGWWKHNRKTGDVDWHITGKLTIAVGGDIRIGAGGNIAENAQGGKITLKAPDEITLGDASTININAKTSTKIVGSTFLTMRANAMASLFGGAFVSIGTFGFMSLKSVGELLISTFTSLTMRGGSSAKLSSRGPLELASQTTAALGAPIKTSVFGAMTCIGGTATHITGLQLVEKAEEVTADVVPPDQPEPDTPSIPLPPLAMTASLPPDTVVDPHPIEPEPYDPEPLPDGGKTPDDPGPEEGPTSKPLIETGAGGGGGSKK